MQYIRLTPDRQSRRGSVWNTVPWNPLSVDGPYPGFSSNDQTGKGGRGVELMVMNMGQDT